MNRSQWITWGAAGLATLGIAVTLTGGERAAPEPLMTAEAPPAATVVPASTAAPTGAPVVHVFKTSTCGCCKGWVAHLEASGFQVVVEDLSQDALNGVKDEQGVAPELRSCHTATVEGYALEGHVPAEDVRRLLAERPEIAGLAVPGMPIGSPGMEMGDRHDKYDVVAFDRTGKRSVYRSY